MVAKAGGGVEGWENRMKVVKRHKFPVIRAMSSGDAMYSMMTTSFKISLKKKN